MTTIAEIEVAIGKPVASWAHSCHAISLQIVRSGVVEGRVARGICDEVPGQHSWVVLGNDCYAKDAQILDATMWSYQDREPYLWEGSAADGLHTPLGAGSIWRWGRPPEATGPVVELDRQPESAEAKDFLDMLGPLDKRGWSILAQAPVEDWPSGEILAAMDDTEALSALVQIDRLGMLTDRNPGGLYLKG